MTNTLASILFALFIFAPYAKASGTVVGNGGDPVFAFMEAARGSMVETLKMLINSPDEQNKFCTSDTLTLEQVTFCRDFFLTVAPDILRLSQGMTKTLFVLREEPLYVEGPDGKPMVVAARTALGPAGPIELHRDAVKLLPPTQVLFLITHEFQHKAIFRDRSMTDNEQIGPFATGRDLIDSAASALVKLARERSKVGSQFGIRDVFDCRAFANSGQFGARLSSSRLFQSQDFMAYETSLGRNPSDGALYLPETSEASLLLRFIVSEPNNCGDSNTQRKSVVQIVRSIQRADGSSEERVVSEKSSGENPICPDSVRDFEIANEQVKFQCRYFGSEGTTSSALPLRSRARHFPLTGLGGQKSDLKFKMYDLDETVQS